MVEKNDAEKRAGVMGQGVALMDLLLFVYSCVFSKAEIKPVSESWALTFCNPWPCEAQDIFVGWVQEASFMGLIWYASSLPFTAFDERRTGWTMNGPSKKEVTVYFWGGFSAFYGFIRAQCTLAVLSRASA